MKTKIAYLAGLVLSAVLGGLAVYFFEPAPPKLLGAAGETKIKVNPPATIIVGDFFRLFAEKEPVTMEWQTGVQVVVNEEKREVLVTGGDLVAITTGRAPEPAPPQSPSSLKSAVRAWVAGREASEVAAVKRLYSGLLTSNQDDLLAAQRSAPVGVSAASWKEWRQLVASVLQAEIDRGGLIARAEQIAAFRQIAEALDQ